MDEQIMADLAQRLEPDLPDAMQRMTRLLHEERFYDMCLEYEDGVRCLRRSREVQRERLQEVTELVDDLEREILQYLKEHY